MNDTKIRAELVSALILWDKIVSPCWYEKDNVSIRIWNKYATLVV